MASLKLVGINKIYDNGFQAVYDFNLDIKDGEFIVFVGPSGCGKSTTLRMIAGLEEITKGELYINDQFVNKKSPRDRGIAMVFQSYALYPQMSVYDNLGFGLTLQGMDDEIIEEKVVKTAKILGLDGLLDRMPRELSGGQRQRVALGRAIIRHVDIFLMDEPLSNLDAKQRVTMRSEIIDIHRKIGATTIYVTHDQTEAMTMADRIIVMKDGYIQQVGTPFDLYYNPVNVFVAGFIGEPPMNFIDAHISYGKVVMDKAEVSYDITKTYPDIVAKYNGQKIITGFRPEAISVTKPEDEAIKLTAKVELTELLGDTANVYLNLGGLNLIVKVEPDKMPKMNSDFDFYIDYKDVFFFDTETTSTIVTKLHSKKHAAGKTK